MASRSDDDQFLTNVDPRLRRAFHPVALSSEVAAAPLPVVLLGERWVLCRLGGVIAAFDDRCPHRGAPLSLGHIEGGDRLRCRYHGWCYGADGAVVEIPALGPEVRALPPCRLTRPAAVVERYGIVWLAPEEPAAGVLDVPEADDPSYDVGFLPPQRAHVGAGLMIDNFLDMAHFPFVHGGTFGADSPEVIREYSAGRVEGGFEVVYDDTFSNREDPGVAAGIRPLLQQWRMTYVYRVPFSVRLRLDFLDAGGANVVAFFVQPETAEECRLYTLLYRDDTAGDAAAMAEAVAYQEAVMAEDLLVQERYEDNRLPLDLRREVHTRADRITLELRRLLRELVAP